MGSASTTEKAPWVSPAEALLRLKEGNFRFINDIPLNRDLLHAVTETSEGQKPFAAVLSCMDSRTSAELIFDQGVGDIFSIRIAGNIVSEGILGSLEYATAVAGSSLILVMGHTNCGAIKGACDDVKLGHITYLMDQVAPAIALASPMFENRTSANKAYVKAVTHYNAECSARLILERSEIIREMVANGKVAIATAIYDVGTAKVIFGK